MEFILFSSYFINDYENTITFGVLNIYERVFEINEVGIMIEDVIITPVRCTQSTESQFVVQFKLDDYSSKNSVKLQLTYKKEVVASENYPVFNPENFKTCTSEVYTNEISVDSVPITVISIKCEFGFSHFNNNDFNMYLLLFIYL